MPKNVMKLMKPSPTLGRNAFDLSHRVVNTLNFGELIPFLNIPTVPDGKYEIKTADLIRAIPMVTSPFMRAKQHIDIWYVPYNLLWSRFNEFMVDKDEPLSSALKNRSFVPHMHLKEMLNHIAGLSDNYRDICGNPFKAGAYRLLDALGYPSFSYALGQGLDEDIPDKVVNLWPILAYNFIWYTFYRQQYYDSGSWLTGNSNAVNRLFNVDYLNCGTEDEADIYRSRDAALFEVESMFQMRYRTWKKDLFTGLMPATQFGSVSAVTGSSMTAVLSAVTGSDIGNWTGSGTYTDTTPVYTNSTLDGAVKGLRVSASAISHTHDVSGNVSMSGGTLFDVLQLRKAEAVQIWRENALRAGNFLEDNFEAHYGVKPKTHMHSHPSLIGSIDAPLNIGDIDSHAQTGDGSNQQLADVAGKGISSLGNGSFHFQSSEHGVILGIVSMLPETEYMSTGIDRANQLLEREDYFIPEYARLGLQPVDGATFFFGNRYEHNLGFAPRDFVYKQQLDKVHLDFFNADGLTPGVFRSWVSPKYDVYDALARPLPSLPLPLSTLYVNPKIFDVNFAVGTDVSRQFMVNCYFDITAIQPMPVTGMPSY